MKFNELMRDKQAILRLGLFMVISLTLVGCSSIVQSKAPQTQTSVQLSWIPNAEFSGIYGAIKQGYYADANLEVKVIPGGYDEDGNYIDPVQRVLDGQADFGIAAGEVILQSRAAGKPIVAIASIYQRSPVVFISLSEKNILKPEDLKGQRVGIDIGSGLEIAFNALLSAQKIDPSEVTVVPREDYTGGPLIRNEVDVMNAFITDEPVLMQLEGHQVNYILASDYGINIYGDVFFTTEDTIAKRPELVEAFLRETLKGYEHAISSPDQAAELVVQHNNDLSLDHQKGYIQAALPLFNPAGSHPGMMTAADWEAAHQILLDQGVLSEPLDVNTIYTLDFLNKIYNQ